MSTANGEADEAVLNMLDRYGVLMLDDLMYRATGFQFDTMVSLSRPAEANTRHRAPSNRLAR